MLLNQLLPLGRCSNKLISRLMPMLALILAILITPLVASATTFEYVGPTFTRFTGSFYSQNDFLTINIDVPDSVSLSSDSFTNFSNGVVVTTNDGHGLLSSEDPGMTSYLYISRFDQAGLPVSWDIYLYSSIAQFASESRNMHDTNMNFDTAYLNNVGLDQGIVDLNQMEGHGFTRIESSSPVPEPSTISMLGVGLALLTATIMLKRKV